MGRRKNILSLYQDKGSPVWVQIKQHNVQRFAVLKNAIVAPIESSYTDRRVRHVQNAQSSSDKVTGNTVPALPMGVFPHRLGHPLQRTTYRC